MKSEKRFYLKNGFALEHLAQNAASTPHVDFGRVSVIPNKELWRSVPECYDLVRKWTGIRWKANSGQAEITEFDTSVFCNQDIRTFQIAVENVVFVAILKSKKNLIE